MRYEIEKGESEDRLENSSGGGVRGGDKGNRKSKK